jgi:hypothetical protein|tara:strand:- start:4933 stop:5235 length:303 start_codon:yes stop_codon:yes gene_type:complete
MRIRFFKLSTSYTVTAYCNGVEVGKIIPTDKHAGLFGRYNGPYTTVSAGVLPYTGSLSNCQAHLRLGVSRKFNNIEPTPQMHTPPVAGRELRERKRHVYS